MPRLRHLHVLSARLPRALLPLLPACLAAVLLALIPRPARAFGENGAFEARSLLAGGLTAPARPTAPARWSFEVVSRTSAPARTTPTQVRADDPAVTDAPFLYLSGDHAMAPLAPAELMGLRRFFALGGVLFVDDTGVTEGQTPGAFGQSARRELARVLPDSVPIKLEADHVVFRSFYLLRRAEGRIAGPAHLEGIVRGGSAQVIFSSHDVGGALARHPGGGWEQLVSPGGEPQRERAVRLAVNIAMYALCSNYKDDQVHAPFLMRRRSMTPRR